MCCDKNKNKKNIVCLKNCPILLILKFEFKYSKEKTVSGYVIIQKTNKL